MDTPSDAKLSRNIPNPVNPGRYIAFKKTMSSRL
jgi:hypothetical protein